MAFPLQNCELNYTLTANLSITMGERQNQLVISLELIAGNRLERSKVHLCFPGNLFEPDGLFLGA